MNSYENPELSELCDLYLEIDRLRAENAKLREALQFYADVQTYKCALNDSAPIDADIGNYARAALKEDV